MFIATEQWILMNKVMRKDTDFIYEAIAKVEELSGIPIEFDSTRPNHDGLIQIKNQEFLVEAGYSGDTDPPSGDIDPLQGLGFKEHERLTILPFFS